MCSRVRATTSATSTSPRKPRRRSRRGAVRLERVDDAPVDRLKGPGLGDPLQLLLLVVGFHDRVAVLPAHETLEEMGPVAVQPDGREPSPDDHVHHVEDYERLNPQVRTTFRSSGKARRKASGAL